MKKRLFFFAAVLAITCLIFSFAPAGNSGNLHEKNSSINSDITPVNLRVPALAFDEKSIVLIWDKPESYSEITDFNVYMDGKLLGSANANNDKTSPAKPYINKFYQDDKDNFHVKILIHNFTVNDLKPETEYSFTVRSVLKNGAESADSNKITQKTTAVPAVFDITKYGAKTNPKKTYTKEIQAAIDACTPGGKVLIPKGTFKSGALFLKSNMILELAEEAVLLGSDKPEDYPMKKGYRLYTYTTNDRPPSLINALSDKREAGAFENIKIVGKGTIDGNGWIKTSDGFITDELGNKLPQYQAGNNGNVLMIGILAKNQTQKALDDKIELQIAYGQKRSSMMTMRGVRNIYYSGITITNPAFHGIMNLECENITVNGVIFKTYDANNGDAVEFGNCDNEVAFNCFVDSGDDCFNFASGTGEEALKQKPSQNAFLFNNYFREGHGAIVAGSHTGAWIQNILAEDNIIFRTEIALRGKTNEINGGGARDIVFRDNAVKSAAKQIFIFTLDYFDRNAALDYTPAKVPGKFKNIYVKNITVENCRGTNASIEIKGYPDKNAFHENLNFENITFRDGNAASIDSLNKGSFKNIKYLKVRGNINPWLIAECIDLKFEGCDPEPKKK